MRYVNPEGEITGYSFKPKRSNRVLQYVLAVV